MTGNWLAMIAFGLFLLGWVFFFVKLFRDRIAPVKKVPAILVHKQTVENFSKYAPTGKHRRYVLVFAVNGKKKYFYVSEFSYNGYSVNKKGILQYKGDRLIGFR